jgi:hypothetical protein
VLDANTSQLQALCSKSGFAAASDSERDGQQEVHEAYRSALREWEGQVLQRYASGERVECPNDSGGCAEFAIACPVGSNQTATWYETLVVPSQSRFNALAHSPPATMPCACVHRTR